MTSPVDQLLCFALYDASHAVTQAYRAVLEPWNLTYTQFLVLVSLSDGERPQRDVAAELRLDSGTLSPLIRRLENRGLIARRRDTDDERVVHLSVTDAGISIRDDVERAVGCLVPAYGLTDDSQRLHLIAMLRDISAGMHQITTTTRAATSA